MMNIVFDAISGLFVARDTVSQSLEDEVEYISREQCLPIFQKPGHSQLQPLAKLQLPFEPYHIEDNQAQ